MNMLRQVVESRSKTEGPNPKIYLLPMVHAFREDAKHVSKRLDEVKLKEDLFVIAFEADNTVRYRSFFAHIGDLKPDEFWRLNNSTLKYPEFCMELFLKFKQLAEHGIIVYPVDRYFENEKFFPLVGRIARLISYGAAEDKFYRKYISRSHFYEMLESTINLYLAKHMVNLLRERAILKNIRWLLDKHQLPVVVAVGVNHMQNIQEGLGDANIEIKWDDEGKYNHTIINFLSELRAAFTRSYIKSDEVRVAAAKVMLTAPVFGEVLRNPRHLSQKNGVEIGGYLEGILKLDSVEAAEALFRNSKALFVLEELYQRMWPDIL